MFGFVAPVVKSEQKGAISKRAVSSSSAPARRSAISTSKSSGRSIPIRRAVTTRVFGGSRNFRSWFGLSLAVGIGVLSVAYVLGVNGYTATGYVIQKEQQNITQLQEEHKKLLVKTAEVGSIAQIQNEATLQNLVAVTSEEFLQPNHFSQR